jgi:hypothetical protein
MIDVGGMMGDRQSDLVYIVYISISTYIIIIVESFAAELSPKNFAAPKSVCQPIKEQLSIIIISSQIGMGPRLPVSSTVLAVSVVLSLHLACDIT